MFLDLVKWENVWNHFLSFLYSLFAMVWQRVEKTWIGSNPRREIILRLWYHKSYKYQIMCRCGLKNGLDFRTKKTTHVTCPGTFSHVSPCYNTRVFYLVCVYQQICFAVSSSQLSTNTLLPQEKGLILEKWTLTDKIGIKHPIVLGEINDLIYPSE